MVIVNDHFTQRNYEKGYAVDAIFVDTITGLNIDIYGVSSLSHSPISNPILHTKTPYSYEFDDIFPLVRTTLDGIPTWRPFNTSKILENEYGYSGTHSNIYMVIFQFYYRTLDMIQLSKIGLNCQRAKNYISGTLSLS
jgi:hypothetical protein